MRVCRSAALGAGLAIAFTSLALAAEPASLTPAASPGFVGRWHWNHTESVVPTGEPIPKDVLADITRADAMHVKWSLTVQGDDGDNDVETYDAPANGEFYPIGDDTTASFQLSGAALHAVFKTPDGATDDQTCTLDAKAAKMSCDGTLDDGHGRRLRYVDVYDRM